MSWKSTVAYKVMKTDELDNVETWQEDNLFVGFENTCEVVSKADLWAYDEGLMDKMSALEILYGSQSTVVYKLSCNTPHFSRLIRNGCKIKQWEKKLLISRFGV